METQHTSFIERYYNQELSHEELIQFEELKKNNDDFNKELELFEKSHEAIKLLTISDLKEDIRTIRETKMPSNKKSTFGFMKIAASILLIAVVGSVFYAQTRLTNNALYDQSYSETSDFITNMDDKVSPMEKAMELYNTGKYAAALEAFSAIEIEDPENQDAKYFMGHSLIKLENFRGAISMFEEIEGPLFTEAQWYIALTQLKKEDIEECKAMLQLIIEKNQDEAFVLKSKRLLKSLNNPLRGLVGIFDFNYAKEGT